MLIALVGYDTRTWNIGAMSGATAACIGSSAARASSRRGNRLRRGAAKQDGVFTWLYKSRLFEVHLQEQSGHRSFPIGGVASFRRKCVTKQV